MIGERMISTIRQRLKSRHPKAASIVRGKAWIWLVVLAPILISAIVWEPVVAQDQIESRVQVIEGYAQAGEGMAYRLSNLQNGQTLYAYVSAISGNLDPFTAIRQRPIEEDVLRTELQQQIDLFRMDGRASTETQSEIYSILFLAWDDDGGEGYDSALSYEIPTDGDYFLFVAGSPSGDSFGDYRLTIGLEAPQVLNGDIEPSGETFVFPEWASLSDRVVVSEMHGSLSAVEHEVVETLGALKPGETLYAYVEATSEDFAPVLVLEDFGGKVLRRANISREKYEATLSYRFEDLANNYQLRVIGAGIEGSDLDGAFRLLVGVNDSNVLKGQAKLTRESILREPIEVEIGVELQQITYVDQVGERFGAVAELEFSWKDQHLAFSPAECECEFRVLTRDEFTDYATEHWTLWPDFTVYNQQGNRWTQNQDVTVWPDGRARYFERFTTDFQAPDFKFDKLPFDTQNLYIRVQSKYPEEFFRYMNLPELSAIGNQLGEEEWDVVANQTEVSTNQDNSMFSLQFDVQRKVNFYVFRIIVPIVLVVVVSWIIFFLNDYTKRIEVASANLIVFVTFNFTISSELPKLGYLTFMDAILIGVFVVSALVVIFNVSLRRMELSGMEELARKLDKIALWAYPLLCGIGGLAAVGYFLV
jgi:hypothetical protein